MAPGHCYLVISPDPSEKNQLYISGTAYGKTDSSKAEPGDQEPLDSQQLQFVKFGDEEGIEARVKQYRTCNPTYT